MKFKILAIAFLLCVLPIQARASELWLCNETGEDLLIAYTWPWSDGSDTWSTDGWSTVKNGKCWWAKLRYETWFFAFLTKTGANPIYSPRDAEKTTTIKKMCVDRKQDKFRYDYKKLELVGKDCPVDSIDVSFGVQGGVNDVKLTLK